MAEPDIGQVLGTGEMTSNTPATDIMTITLTTAQTAGRTVFGAFGSLTVGTTINGSDQGGSHILDSKGGTWSATAIRNVQNITNAETYFYARKSGPLLEIGDTVTVDYSGDTHAVGLIFDAIGCGTTESAGGQQGTTSATPSVSITRTLTDSLTIACVTENAAAIDASLTQDADYSSFPEVQHAGANLRLTVAYRDRTTTGNDTYAPTLSGARAVAITVSDFGIPPQAGAGELIPMTGAG